MEISPESKEAIAVRRHGSLTATVHGELQDMILRGELAAGERLNEQRLASALGVSRGPIREAARMLEHDGLVVSMANQGVFVRQLSLEDALELYDLRALIAGYLCSCVASRASKAEVAELRTLIARMDDCIAAEDEEGYFALNLHFHEALAAVAQAPRATKTYASLDREVRLLRRRVLRGLGSMRFSNDEHREILAAIEARDADLARAAGEKHHLNGKRRWMDTL